jgi:hypothetical protein
MRELKPKRDYGAWLQTAQAIATIFAIIVGGIWTYMLFIEQRQGYARLNIEHHVTHVSLPEHRILLVVDVIRSNVGSVRVPLTSGDLRIYGFEQQALNDGVISQLNGSQNGIDETNVLWEVQAELPTAAPPPPDISSEILAKLRKTWKPPNQFVVEPGESDQLHYEFILSDDAPLLVYTYFKNPTITDQEIGWTTKSLYDPRKKAEPVTKP